MIKIHDSNFICGALAKLRVDEVVGSPVICPGCSYSLRFQGSGFKSESRLTSFRKKRKCVNYVFCQTVRLKYTKYETQYYPLRVLFLTIGT